MSAAAMLAATPSLASGPGPVLVEMPVEVIEAPADNFWEGPWVGLSLGMGSTNYDLSGSVEAGPLSAGLNLPDLGGTGALLGIQAGYNFRLSDRMIAGVVIDATMSNITNDTSAFLSIGPNELAFNYDLAPERMYTIAGRLGYLPTPDTQVYGLLGYTRADYVADLSLAITPGPTFTDSYSFDMDGVTVGVGIETRVTETMSIGLEYRYTDLGRFSFIDDTFGPLAVEAGFDAVIQTVRASVNFHF